MTSARAAPDLDAEAEVDLAHYARLLLVRWWLLLAGLVVGAILGYLTTLGGSQFYRASAVVYMGQPLGILGSNPVQALQTNPSTARTIVTSEDIVQRVAAKARMSPARLGSGISVNAISGSLSKVGQTPLIQINVKGPAPAKVETASLALANVLVSELSSHARSKIKLFTNLQAQDKRAIDEANKALASPDLSTTEKLLLQLRIQSLQDDYTQTTQLLSLATDVEAPRVITEPVGAKTSVRNHRNSTAVGAVIGLILGAIAALLWEPVARLRAA